MVCTSPEILASHVETDLRHWAEQDASSIFVSLDGLPGAGKTTLRHSITDVVGRIGDSIHLKEVPIDDFIASDRDSSERRMMLERPELFWKILYSRNAILDVLGRIGAVNGEPLELQLMRMYNRKIGRVVPGTIEVPAGKKVVLVEGMDSTSVVNELRKRTSCKTLTITLLVRPKEALRRAIERDVREGRRTEAEARHYRTTEYKYLVPRIHEENAAASDYVLSNG